MTKSNPDALAAFPIVMDLAVQWGDQDAFGHVNNTVPIRWFESARVAYFEQSGLEQLMSNTNVGIILASITCNYRLQLSYPDHIWIGARVTEIGNSSIHMEHGLYSESQQQIAVDGASVIVAFNYDTQKSERVADDVRQRIQEIESRSQS